MWNQMTLMHQWRETIPLLLHAACIILYSGCVASQYSVSTDLPLSFLRSGSVCLTWRPSLARRSAECFVQVVNLLNSDYEARSGEDLCEGVLRTLAALLAGNEASRRRLAADVGYDQILTALARQVKNICQGFPGFFIHGHTPPY